MKPTASSVIVFVIVAAAAFIGCTSVERNVLQADLTPIISVAAGFSAVVIHWIADRYAKLANGKHGNQ